MDNYVHYKVCNEFTYPFPNFNGAILDFWEWTSKFILHFSRHVIAYPCWDSIVATEGSSQSGSETFVAKIWLSWVCRYPGSAMQGRITMQNSVHFTWQLNQKIILHPKQKHWKFHITYINYQPRKIFFIENIPDLRLVVYPRLQS